MTETAHVDRFVLDRLPAPELLPEFLFDLPELQYPERLNAAVALLEGGEPEAFAVQNDAGRWTYAEMSDRSDRIAQVLVEEGLVPGNRVLLRGPNTAMLLACWLGVLKAGGVAVATVPVLRAAELAPIIRRADISHALVDARCPPDLDAAVTEAGFVRSVLSYDGDGGGGVLEARMANVAPDFAPVDTRGDDPALIAFTSGTTGVPKGCVHLHRDVLAAADSFARRLLAPKRGERWACSAPLAFTFGLGQLLIFPFRFGGTTVTCEEPGPGPLPGLVERHRVDILATAPTAYKAMLGELAGRDLSSLRACVSAGEHLPAATWEAWRGATGLRIIDGIGATEMMHIFVSAAGDDIRPGATGRAVPGYLAAVLDEGGRPMNAGVGRLAVKGPTGCRYLGDPRQADYVQGGWNVTGDIYRRDAGGYLRFVARADDMIVSAGYNIAAPEVEGALLAHSAVRECAVVGVPCEQRGQKVKAVVVPAPGHSPSPELAAALQAHVKAVIAPYKYPREVIFAAALPRTPTGKLSRSALRG